MESHMSMNNLKAGGIPTYPFLIIIPAIGNDAQRKQARVSILRPQPPLHYRR